MIGLAVGLLLLASGLVLAALALWLSLAFPLGAVLAFGSLWLYISACGWWLRRNRKRYSESH